MMAKHDDKIDIVGRPLTVGDAVAFYWSTMRGLQAGRITRFTAKKVEVSWMHKGAEFSHLAYPFDVAILPMEDYLFFAMKK